MLRALLFDVDGTLAETEEAHRKAWNTAFAANGLDWHWDRALYGQLLQIAGGNERLAHFAAGRIEAEAIAAIHAAKNRAYQHAAQTGAIPLRPGVAALMGEARARGLRLAIATTSSRANVEALVAGALGEHALSWFAAWACAEDAAAKKPDPAVYHAALRKLGLTADAAVAFEDSRNGLLAAHRAGIRVVFSHSLYMANDRADEALMVLPDLAAIPPARLLDMLAV